MSRPRITLLTDYGTGGEHVGALHAVLAAGCPEADRVDLAHDVPPGDVRQGAVLLARLAPLLPGAVHLAVVDPGVGTDRPGVAVRLADGGALVGPDNGLLGAAADALGAAAAAALPVPAGAAATFHGRDVFAPAAARIAAGAAPEDLGEPVAVAGIRRPELPPPRVGPGSIAALALGADRFGNVQLLAGPEDLRGAGFSERERIWAATGERRHPATVARVFADVAPGALLVHVDSHGMLALAVNGGSAARRVGVEPGDTVSLGRW